MNFINKYGKGILICLLIAIPSWIIGKMFPVVGGAVITAAELLFIDFAVKTVAQHGTPAARAGIAAACAVGVHFDLLHAVLLIK